MYSAKSIHIPYLMQGHREPGGYLWKKHAKTGPPGPDAIPSQQTYTIWAFYLHVSGLREELEKTG